MTTDELLEKLPKMIGNNRIYDNGRFTGWYSISSPYDSIEWLQLCNDGEHRRVLRLPRNYFLDFPSLFSVS
jgi:hypothetical protein